MKVRTGWWIAFLTLVLLVSLGCIGSLPLERTEVEDIPDGLYEVYVYRSREDRYAVVLDIPDDGKRVYMSHTDRTRRIGRDRPGSYVEEFRRRIKGFRWAIKIRDNDGLMRGYLMVSPTLGYRITHQADDIVVQIWYPFAR